MGGLFPPEEKCAMEGGNKSIEGVEHGGDSVGGLSLPCPGFEGFEKRLEVEFWEVGTVGENAGEVLEGENLDGLRRISREDWDVTLSSAACTIVSQLPNEYFDSYVLSESSLFVYPKRVVIKTCGTTKLLDAIPNLLKSAEKVGFLPLRCRYTRGTFMFPQVQPDPHHSFDSEAKVLEKHFGHLGGGGKAFVLGDALKFPNWHVYVSGIDKVSKGVEGVVGKIGRPESQREPVYTMEMCMTKLDRTVASQFYQEAGFASAAECTKASGIGELLPKSHIDDFLFEPCGYSMNGIEGNAHSTVHITPEDGFSYASFETMGYGNDGPNLGKLVKNVLETFKPGKFSLALHSDGEAGPGGPGSWGGQLPELESYYCEGTSHQELPMGSSVVFHTFKALDDRTDAHMSHLPVSPIPLQLETIGGYGKRSGKDLNNLSRKSSVFELELLSGVKNVNSLDLAVKETYLNYGPSAAAVLASVKPSLVGSSPSDVDKFISSVVRTTEAEAAFYLLDLGVVMRLWKLWTTLMPRVTPFYAVKCNPDPAIIALLSSLGTGFDVASKAELDAVTSIGVSPDNIIYANPCKLPTHIRAAKEKDVAMTTFDSESELFKLKKYHPEAHAVLRIRADDRNARCPLGVKYGAEIEDCEDLLKLAKKLNVKVTGVAFHVGSGASNPQAFADGIESARSIFDMAESLGMEKMTLLDIGGGFTSKGGQGVGFNAAASAINSALDMYFPEGTGVRVIAEPGRFFAEAPATLATHVFGTRVRKGGEQKREYWINDGLYGSMNCLLYDHAELSTRPVAAPGKEREMSGNAWNDSQLYLSTIFGPTCDGLDTVLRDIWLPQLECGDWLVFPRMGAYTQAAGSSFNGFSSADIVTHYVYSSPNEEGNGILDCLGDSDSDSYGGGEFEDSGALPNRFSNGGQGSGDSSSDFGEDMSPGEFSSGSDDDSF